MESDHVLLVDDDVIINLNLHEFLQDAGFTVEAVYSGTAAYEAIKRHPPWALVTDLDLGLGPDGFQVARYARAACPGLPVVFISGTMSARYDNEGVKQSDFIAKPFRGQQIVEALHRAARPAVV